MLGWQESTKNTHFGTYDAFDNLVTVATVSMTRYIVATL